MDRITDHSDMTSAVDLGRTALTTNKQIKNTRGSFSAVANPVGQSLRGFVCFAIHGL